MDENGIGYAQPDHYIVTEKYILLFECKLKQTNGAVSQMIDLYKPLLEHIYGLPVFCIQVFKFFTWGIDKHAIEHPRDIAYQAPQDHYSWYNLG